MDNTGRELLDKKQLQMAFYSLVNFFSTDKYVANDTTMLIKETKDYKIKIKIEKKECKHIEKQVEVSDQSN